MFYFHLSLTWVHTAWPAGRPVDINALSFVFNSVAFCSRRGCLFLIVGYCLHLTFDMSTLIKPLTCWHFWRVCGLDLFSRKDVQFWYHTSRWLPWALTGISQFSIFHPVFPLLLIFLSLHCWLSPHTVVFSMLCHAHNTSQHIIHNVNVVNEDGEPDYNLSRWTLYNCRCKTYLIFSSEASRLLRPVTWCCREDKWALKHKWQLHERSICAKQSEAEDVETEKSFYSSFLQISE